MNIIEPKINRQKTNKYTASKRLNVTAIGEVRYQTETSNDIKFVIFPIVFGQNAIKVDALMSLCTHQVHKMDLVLLFGFVYSTHNLSWCQNECAIYS